jgi:hypothetical protein
VNTVVEAYEHKADAIKMCETLDMAVGVTLPCELFHPNTRTPANMTVNELLGDLGIQSLDHNVLELPLKGSIIDTFDTEILK